MVKYDRRDVGGVRYLNSDAYLDRWAILSIA